LEKEEKSDGPALAEVLHAINMLHQKVDLILSRKMPYTINLFNGQHESESELESPKSSETHQESTTVQV
jgi:hypothetical protein